MLGTGDGQHLNSPLQGIGGGRKRKKVGGKYAGPRFLKQPRPVMNYYIVGARDAGGDASV